LKRFIIDCSVSASWFLKDESNEEANKVLAMLMDHEMVVPSLWPIEMANVLVIAERKKRITAADAARVVELFLSLPIEVDLGGLQNLRVLQLLALEYGLTVYDACYLELAQRKGLPLASLDQTLNKAAEKCGVPVFIVR
jgi:predicted nucleic acid-binding protein